MKRMRSRRRKKGRGKGGRNFVSREWIVAKELLNRVGNHCRQGSLLVIMQICKASNGFKGNSSGQRERSQCNSRLLSSWECRTQLYQGSDLSKLFEMQRKKTDQERGKESTGGVSSRIVSF